MTARSEQSDNITCFICEQNFETDVAPVVVIRLERKDDRYRILLEVSAIKVHVKYLGKYTLKKEGKLKNNAISTSLLHFSFV